MGTVLEGFPRLHNPTNDLPITIVALFRRAKEEHASLVIVEKLGELARAMNVQVLRYDDAVHLRHFRNPVLVRTALPKLIPNVEYFDSLRSASCFKRCKTSGEMGREILVEEDLHAAILCSKSTASLTAASGISYISETRRRGSPARTI